MPRQPKRKYGKYDFFVTDSGKIAQLTGVDKRGFLYNYVPLKSFRRMK